MPLDSVKVTIRGKHNTGRTTMASLIKMFLEENGYSQVQIKDTPPLPPEQKDRFMDRFMRNRERPVNIVVELDDPTDDEHG